MKTYEKLTKAEREKLTLFLQYVSLSHMKFLVIYLIGCIFVAIGIPLLLIFSLPIISLTGYLMLVFGCMFIISALVESTVQNKNMFLIFGYKESFKEVFGITKMDLRKIKITKEVKWNWKKEN